MKLTLDAATCLPADAATATLVGRAQRPARSSQTPGGPSVVVLRDEDVFDISDTAATVAELMNAEAPLRLIDEAEGERIGSLDALLANSACHARDPAKPYFLAPCDLHAIKACGVTFANSMVERVIEEQAKGDPAKADAIRATIGQEIGGDLGSIRPGSPEAARLKEALVKRGLWSQYLEVGIGPDAEVFTKAPPLSAVGPGAEVGLHPASSWNNPEPEVVLAVNARGATVGATLGNDVNLRDVEGRSALLLGKAKDNNASCAIGPFLRLFDGGFTIDDLRQAEVTLTVEGDDRFVLSGTSSLRLISRDPLDLVRQTINENHQYPDGLFLFTGTMFAPTQDRDGLGKGFTHKLGDVVTIASPKLGALVNCVTTSDKAPPWTFGAVALMRNLAARGLL